VKCSYVFDYDNNNNNKDSKNYLRIGHLHNCSLHLARHWPNVDLDTLSLRQNVSLPGIDLSPFAPTMPVQRVDYRVEAVFF